MPPELPPKRRTHRPATRLAVALAIVVVAAARVAGQTLLVEGESASPARIGVGHAAAVDVLGPAHAPLLAVVGFGPRNLATPYGTLGLDVLDPAAFAYLDGFTPSHPAYAASRVGAAGGSTWSYVPFVGPMVPAITSFLTQALVADPTAPLGAALTNLIVVTALLPAPAVHGTSQNVAAPGNVLTLHGTGFVPGAGANAVGVEGRPFPVLAATTTTLSVAVPAGAASGPFRVTTSGGSAEASPEDIDTWCAVLPPVILESQAPAVLGSDTTVQGVLATAAESDVYRVHVNAGDALYVEAYAFDPVTGRLRANTPASPALDPRVEVRRGGVVLAEDEESGPGTNAAIGLPRGASFFVADASADFEIAIRGAAQAAAGAYLLALRTGPPAGFPLHLSGLSSNLARVGDQVALHATGFDPASTTLRVELDGRPCPIVGRAPGRIDVRVPPGARSGPVVIVDGAARSIVDRERLTAWLTILGPNVLTAVEGRIEALGVGDSAIGRIDGLGDQDVFRFLCQARHRYRIEVSAIDLASVRIVSGTFAAGTVLDPEGLVFSARTTSPFLAIDGNSGPGLNVLFDEAAGSACFVPQRSDAFDLVVQAFAHATMGDYLVRVVDLGP